MFVGTNVSVTRGGVTTMFAVINVVTCRANMDSASIARECKIANVIAAMLASFVMRRRATQHNTLLH